MEDQAHRVFATRIAEALEDPACEAVAQYFDPRRNYAGASFNTIGTNEPNAIEAGDILAVHLLDIRFSPLGVRRLLTDEAERREVSALLAELPTDVDLWGDRAEVGDGSRAERLWERLKTYDNVGSVTAGKLLARKRPRLIPIYDSVVGGWLNPPTGLFWASLQTCLRNEDVRHRIEGLRPEHLGGEESRLQVTTLRLLDVAVWMRGMGYGPFRASQKGAENKN